MAAVPKDSHVPRLELEKRLADQVCFREDLLADDVSTLTGIRFKLEALVAADQAMSSYLKRVGRLPKAARAAAFA
jgi:hypothetical protein